MSLPSPFSLAESEERELSDAGEAPGYVPTPESQPEGPSRRPRDPPGLWFWTICLVPPTSRIPDPTTCGGCRNPAHLGPCRNPSAPLPAPPAIDGGAASINRPSLLPGQGTSGANCGDWEVTHICKTDRLAAVAPHECMSPGCPECAAPCEGREECAVGLPPHPGGKWSHQAALEAADRFEDFIEQMGLDGPRSPIAVRQNIYSVPVDRFLPSGPHRKTIATLRREAESLLKPSRGAGTSGRPRRQRGKLRSRGGVAWMGRYAGALVVHLYRGCEGRYEEWGPHVHIVGFGIDVRKWWAYLDDYHRRHAGGRGLTDCRKDGPCRRHREDPVHFPRCPGSSPRMLKQVRDQFGGFATYRGARLRRLLVYELSHASFAEGRPDRRTGRYRYDPALTWFGRLHTWKQPVRRRPRKCPRCECPMLVWDRRFRSGWSFHGLYLEKGSVMIGLPGEHGFVEYSLMPGPPVRSGDPPNQGADK